MFQIDVADVAVTHLRGVHAYPRRRPRVETVATGTNDSNIVVDQLAAQLLERGYEVDANVGQSGFRCDLAVRIRGERSYRLGIMVDTDAYYQNTDLLDRDVFRPSLLRQFGWNVVLILTKNWFEDSNAVMRSLEKRLAVAPIDST